MQLLTSVPFQIPKGKIDYYRSLLSTGSPTFWYDYTIGYRYTYNATDLSGNGNNGSASSSLWADSAWYASQAGGVIHFNNSTWTGGYTMKSPDIDFTSSNFFLHVGFQWVSFISGNSNIIVGGYDSGAGRDWWVGMNSSNQLLLSANGNTYLFGTTLTSGVYYMLTVKNNYTGTTSSGDFSASIKGSDGTDIAVSTSDYTILTNVGSTGFSTYGNTNYGYYTTNFKLGHAVGWNYDIGTYDWLYETLLNQLYSRKYGFGTEAAETEPLDIYSSNTTIPINITYQTLSTADSDASYNVLERALKVTSGTSDTGHLYIGVRNSASTTFYGDLALSHIQILSKDGGFRTGAISGATRAYDFSFNVSTLGYGLFSTTTAASQTSTTTNPNTYSYTTVSTSVSVNRWGAALGTGSSYTGANNGTYTSSYSGLGVNTTTGGSTLPLGTHSLPQATSTRFLYPEASGMTAGHITWLKSPQLTLYNGDIIRLAYLATAPNTGAGLQANNTLYFRWA